jgi:hypothetical protein
MSLPPGPELPNGERPVPPVPPGSPSATMSGAADPVPPRAGPIGGSTDRGPTVAAAPAAAPAADQDWTDQVTDLIVDSVDKVRARTTGPILEGAKGAVYAIVALVLLVPILVLGMVGLVRLLNWAIPGDVWIVYALLGIIFVIVGVVLWSRRGKPATKPATT